MNFQTLQHTSSECIFGNMQNDTLPIIVSSFSDDDGRKEGNIGSVGRKAGSGKGRGTGTDSSVEHLRNGGIEEIERDVFGRPILGVDGPVNSAGVDGPVNLAQSGQGLTDKKNGVFETSFSFSKSSNFIATNFINPLTQDSHGIHGSSIEAGHFFGKF
jgi:hypothetical protein